MAEKKTNIAKATRLIAATAVLMCSAAAQASTYKFTLPDYHGMFSFPAPGASPQSLGSFAFGIPASEMLSGANFSGYFGQTSGITSSAPARVFADGVLVATCGASTACTSTGPTAWSYSFNAGELALFSDGSLPISFSQDSFGAVQMSGLTLTLNTVAASVPEPSTFGMLLLGLIPLAVFRQRRK